ncbi:MAG: ribonuclease E [Planctomycetaceae bacterium]|jgi:ribonuclease E
MFARRLWLLKDSFEGMPPTSGDPMKKEMLINVRQPEESRIGVVEDGVLEELYVERNSLESCVGNIYKGRVVNIEPSIQAAFVDFGVGRNGFLHVSDVENQYFKHLIDEETETKQKNGKRFNERSVRNKPPIQEILRKGSEVLVQVIKEGVGSKGPTLSTYISIPGRYLVLMPGLQRVGVSRKIADDDARRKLRKQLVELDPPPGLGFIIRTAGLERSQEDLERDLHYLIRLWKVIFKRIGSTSAPVDIYQDSDMITRTIRDIFSSDIDSIWIDEPEAYERACEFMKAVLPNRVDRIRHYSGQESIFHKYQIEEEISRIQNRTVPLKGGGSIVIDQTEALVAIDVNSGSFRIDDDAEETSYQVNLRAAGEVARQIRLRDMGGVIVIDFIDMREEKHRRGVERALRNAMLRDRARSKVLRISPFGLIEMTRQRIRPSLRRSIYKDCPCCNGTGLVKTAESAAIEIMRALITAASRDEIEHLSVEVEHEVADYLSNRKRREINAIEDKCQLAISIRARTDVTTNHIVIEGKDAAGHQFRIPIPGDSQSGR